ncbi:hypothetical protein VCHENC02_0991B, partial [Vibrio harveyi]
CTRATSLLTLGKGFIEITNFHLKFHYFQKEELASIKVHRI